jgi:hypothetical protein
MNTLTTAAGVVLVGVGGAFAYTQIQKGRALASGVKSAQQLAAAGGDPSTLNTVLDAFKAAGGETGGAAQAAGAVASNDNAGTYGVAVLDAASGAMRKAGSPAQLGRNLRVVRPKDKSSQWVIGEGCWLPSEGEANGFRTNPVDLVRGLDMGYALTYLPDVYPAPSDGGVVIAYPPQFGHWAIRVMDAKPNRSHTWHLASAQGIANQYQVMITSTAQGGGAVALWNPRTSGFMPAGTPVKFAISKSHAGDWTDSYGRHRRAPSTFLNELADALQARPVFQPFPPVRLSSRRNR